MGFRRKSRVLVVQALYSMEMGKDFYLDFSYKWETQKKITEEVLVFSNYLLKGTIDNLENIDYHIKKSLENWKFDRLFKVDLSILRLAVFEILYCDEIPNSVTINEAIDISKDYSEPDAYKFINGVLDKVSKRIAEDKKID